VKRNHFSLLLAFLLTAALLLAWGCDQQAQHTGEDEYASLGVDKDEIRIGSSLALSGHASFLGTQTLRGALSYINFVNDNGGVHGRKITLIALDDQYDPPKCVANTQRLLVEENAFALFCYVGTPTTVKIIPMVEKARTPLVGMFTGANALRDPFQRYIINVRASYYQETEAAVRHMVEDLNMRKIAVFYQYDAYGFDGLMGTELALQKYDLAPVANGSYIRGTLDVEEGLSKILDSDAEAVVMIGTYEPCAKFIKLALAAGRSPLFYNVSFVGAEELARLLGPMGDGVLVSQVVPPPDLAEARNMLWGVEEYIGLLKRYFPDENPNSVGLEGYYNAKVLVEGLQRAGPDLTRERFLDALETIGGMQVGPKSTLAFSPTDHQGMDQVYFTRIENGKLVLVTDWSQMAGWFGNHGPSH
jgi:ABC-type branched-subunit amino acid transport system substrate-binding protein